MKTNNFTFKRIFTVSFSLVAISFLFSFTPATPLINNIVEIPNNEMEHVIVKDTHEGQLVVVAKATQFFGYYTIIKNMTSKLAEFEYKLEISAIETARTEALDMAESAGVEYDDMPYVTAESNALGKKQTKIVNVLINEDEIVMANQLAQSEYLSEINNINEARILALDKAESDGAEFDDTPYMDAEYKALSNKYAKIIDALVEMKIVE